MSTEPVHPDTCTEPRPASERTPDLLVGRDAEERADIEEDRRRQRELGDGELGAEAWTPRSSGRPGPVPSGWCALWAPRPSGAPPVAGRVAW